ncbi:hypothetical protein ERJ75_001055200 [Trypanosoma vivax]|uniref:Uncharacterized protein n=1 Tax=Trypanosoma vivax (strain Y486) TaxID=1055687 RepID=G0U0E6_TRYVY|nr:hypothetical protein TRVL_04184 [Trypanosoma vivax]KAH8611014.1 hypothetical protein ERJ75_001055200 [Trypanosoma vivax]CCC49544.1 conserved hypothetical protein [Trypanosoma vivax Y486]
MSESEAVVVHEGPVNASALLEERRSQVRNLELQLMRKEAELRRAQEEQVLLKELQAVNAVTLRKRQKHQTEETDGRLKIAQDSLEEVYHLESEIKMENRRTEELQKEANITSFRMSEMEKDIEDMENRTAAVKRATYWDQSKNFGRTVVNVTSDWMNKKRSLTALHEEQSTVKGITSLLDERAEHISKKLEMQKEKAMELVAAQKKLREKSIEYESLLEELRSFERLSKKKERLLDSAGSKPDNDYKTLKIIEGDKKVLYCTLSKLQESSVRNSKSILSLEVRLRQLETKLEAVNLFLQQVFADMADEDEQIENIPEDATEVTLEQFEDICRELELSRTTLLQRDDQLDASDAKVEQLERKTSILENAIASHAVSAQLEVKGKERDFETLMMHVDYMTAEFNEEYARLTRENAELMTKLGKC